MVKQTLLLVDNDSDSILELRMLCDRLGYDVETVHCSRLDTLAPDNYALTVLSGGFWYDDEMKHLEQYASELQLIRASEKPVIGICLGMQLLHVADSGEVPLLADAQSGIQRVRLTPEGIATLRLPEHIDVHKNHTRGVNEALPDYTTLGVSPVSVEIMQHRTKPLIGVQFHPELGDESIGLKIMQSLLRAVSREPQLSQSR